MADTIFAPASGAGRAAVTVMRLSGPRSGAILRALCGRVPPPRRASLRRLRDANGETLDHALVLFLPGPGSYTGEECAELHLHGGRAVREAVADALAVLGARPAEAGEFTRRAFLNGRLDLTAAEGIADLVAAESAAQRRQALAQMEGALGRLYEGWTARLTRLLARQEALIDFPDEDLPAELARAMVVEMRALAAEIAAHLNDGRRGERVREGLFVAVSGPPNVGKSSLINRLAERDLAIVSATPGTTRDPIEARVVLGGIAMTLVDTAGLRAGADAVEAEGVRRARAWARTADIVLAVYDATAPDAGLGVETGAVVLRVGNKIDLLPPLAAPPALPVSAATGEGLEVLRAALVAHGRSLTEAEGPPPLTRVRHRSALGRAVAALVAAQAVESEELRAEELRAARRAIGVVTGQVGVEGVLDAVFGEFCIGK